MTTMSMAVRRTTMRGPARWLILPALVATMMVVAVVPARADSCAVPWGSAAKQAGSLRTAPLVATRTGRHACFDRVVFEFRGAATGYRVSYVDTVVAEGSGRPLPVAGGAKLQIQLLDPAYDVQGHATYPYRVGQHVADLSGYRTLRDLVYGGTFEGYTGFGLGARARLPFRVLVLTGPGSYSRIVVDVAHQW
ncbi:MAG TPA: hypothetical protein VI248_29545 [Kineosporiaceae bacterium]